jgi:hypothetical protein
VYACNDCGSACNDMNCRVDTSSVFLYLPRRKRPSGLVGKHKKTLLVSPGTRWQKQISYILPTATQPEGRLRLAGCKK